MADLTLPNAPLSASATVGWPGMAVSIDTADHDMPDIRRLLEGVNLRADRKLDEYVGLNPTFLGETAAAFKNDQRHPMRMRMTREGGPAVFDTHDIEDSRTVLLMPVRLPS
jgi:hypothetical protein